jgi:hypothetical protein
MNCILCEKFKTQDFWLGVIASSISIVLAGLISAAIIKIGETKVAK